MTRTMLCTGDRVQLREPAEADTAALWQFYGIGPGDTGIIAGVGYDQTGRRCYRVAIGATLERGRVLLDDGNTDQPARIDVPAGPDDIETLGAPATAGAR